MAKLKIGIRRDYLMPALLVIAFLAIIAAIVLFYVSTSASTHQQQWSVALHDTQSAGADIAQRGADITAGLQPAFDQLAYDVAQIDTHVQGLHKGNVKTGMPALPASVTKKLARFTHNWQTMKGHAAVIGHSQKAYKSAVNVTTNIVRAAPQVAQNYAAIVKGLAADGRREKIGQATDQLTLIGTIADIARAVNAARSDPARQLARLNTHIKTFLAENQALGTKNPDIAAHTEKVSKIFAPYATATDQLLEKGAALDKIQKAGSQLNNFGYNDFLPSIFVLSKAVKALGQNNALYRILAYAAAAITLLALIAFAIVFSLAQIRRRRRVEEREQKQQEAILNLLDEITGLSDGDLTTDMTVTQEFTGVIADSINYTIEALRRIIGTINTTSESINSAAGSSSATAQRMRSDSEQQAKDIATMTTIMADSSEQLQRVSQQAQTLVEQARTSVETAHTGTLTVGRTTESMAALREQIQDTAKRIKRLGESSQEIGDITETIDDIAEQTNTLALNASIQAATAGEAGRGFAVVANEVQRLAERAATATRRIETLIRTIQTETNDAVVSMEQSTTNVVAGARSAEEAGQALARIEAASQQLAGTIGEISTATQQQSEVATRISGNMESIRAIADQTSESARLSSEEAGGLNTLSDRLRESVAGFKLPGSAVEEDAAVVDTAG